MPKTNRKGAPAGKRKSATAAAQIFVSKLNKKYRVGKKELSVLAGQILKGEKKPGEIDIILADDRLLKSLNTRFAGKRKTTDVLSFPLAGRLDRNSKTYWGEIYISLNQAKRQAQDFGIALQDEVLKLVCHGTLHLLGYDHKKKKDALRMQARERKYLNEN